MLTCMLLGLLFTVLTLRFSTAVTVSGYIGCFQEDIRQRHFSSSPGSYVPNAMTSSYCREQCGLYGYAYAAVTNGKFCFCSQSLIFGSFPDVDSACDEVCSGDINENCGSLTHVGVYETTKSLSGLKATSNVNGISATPTYVSLSISIESGSNVLYQVDYDDGAGLTAQNETGFNQRVLYLPGDYSVIVSAKNNIQALTTAVGFTLDQPVSDLEVTCIPFFVTSEEGNCTITVWRGSNLLLDATVTGKSEADVHIDSIADAKMVMIGAWTTLFDDYTGAHISDTIFLSRSILFPTNGKVYGWRMHVSKAGSLPVMILSPSCGTSQYCYSTDDCQSTCESKSSNSRSFQCCPNDYFCLQYNNCSTSCTPSNNPCAVNNYIVKYSVTVSLTALGSMWIDQNPALDVAAGDIIGIFKTASGGYLSNRVNSPNEDVTTPTSPAPTKDQVYSNVLCSPSGKSHAIQALFSTGSKTLLTYTFVGNAGEFPLNVVVKNKNLAVPTATTTTTIIVLEGIDFAIIEGVLYASTGSEYTFSLAKHTGSNVTYEWNVDDGSPQVNTMSLLHTFTSPGTYNVSISLYNAISRKNNFTIVIVQDKVEGLAITATDSNINVPVDFTISITQGTDYTCNLDFNDGSSVVVADDTQILIPTSIQSHSYSKHGLYNVTITCSNMVSSATAFMDLNIQAAITDLRLEKNFAIANTPFSIAWLITTGSNVDFSLKFDGNVVAVNMAASTPDTYRWESVQISGIPAGNYSLVLEASNALSADDLNVDFMVINKIVNPTFISDLTKATCDDVVTFTLNMASGSYVTVSVDFQDGSQPYQYYSKDLIWPKALTIPHTFLIGGLMEVKATVSNPADSVTLMQSISVKIGFSTISWSLSDSAYYLYMPPAFVSFNFTSNNTGISANAKVTIDWGDGTPLVTADSITFGAPGYYHFYDDTLDYKLTVTLSDSENSKKFIHLVKVVEQLMYPNIILEFPDAPLNEPYSITFTLYRGDQDSKTTLTWELDDGNPPVVKDRKGVGPNGGDTLTVTYSTPGTKTVKVTATAPLNQMVFSSKTFNVIAPIDASVLTVIADDQSFNSPTIFQIRYASAPVPAGAKVQIDAFGDASVVTPAEPFIGSQDISYLYSKDGVHEAKVIVYNSASKVVVNVQVGVFKQFLNLKATMTFISGGSSVDQNGLQNDGLTYPLDTPVKFSISDDNNAFATVYHLVSTSGPQQIEQDFSDNDFLFQFPKDDNYMLSLKAENPKAQSTIQIPINIIRRVYGLSVVSVNEKVAPGQLKQFKISFVDYGDDTCVYIDWNDLGAKSKFENKIACNNVDYLKAEKGTMTQLTANAVGHRYLVEGVYTVKLVAQNAYGSETFQTTFTVSYMDCSKPHVSIQQSLTLEAVPKYPRSGTIQLRGLADIYCSKNLANTKSWDLEMIDGVTKSVLSSIIMSGLVIYKAELYIPALYLQVGYYKATYSVYMNEGYPKTYFLDSSVTFFEVTESELIGRMIANSVSETTIGSAQRLILEPLKYSQDPDIDPTADQGLIVDSWKCQVIYPINANQDSCKNVKGGVSSQDIDGASLTQGYIYNITANLSKGARKQSAYIYVIVNGTNPLSGTISCFRGSLCYPESNGYTILDSSRLSLQCECPSCTTKAQYEWSVYITDYRWQYTFRPIKREELLKWCYNLNYREVSFEKDFFSQYKDPTNMFRVQCSITDGTNSGTVATHMQINRGPSGGTCSIDPLSITKHPIADKQCLLTCDGWKDNIGIKEYQVYSIFQNQEEVREITSFPTSKGGITDYISLPIGPSYNNFQQDVYVTVRDLLSATTTYKIGTVEVRPPNNEELRKYLGSELSEKSNDYFKVFEEGDQRSVSEMASAFASTLSQDAAQSCYEYDGYEVPDDWICTGYGPDSVNRVNAYEPFPDERDPYKQYAFDKQRDNRAQFRTNIVKSVLTLSFEDAISIQHVSGLLAQVTASPTEITPECQKLVIGALEEMINNLLDPKKMANTPQEDIERSMSHIYSCLGNIIESVGQTGFFPTKSDMEETRKDPLWKVYDTSIKSLGDDTDVSKTRSYDEANNIHTRRVFKILYKDQAHELALKIDIMIKQLTTLFDGFSIPGSVKKLTTQRLKFAMEKNFIEEFTGRSIQVQDSNAEVALPATMADLFPTNNVAPDDVAILKVMQTTNTPERYTKSALESFSGYSHFVSVDLTQEKGSVIPVEQTKEEIKIVIPNDQNGPNLVKIQVNPFVSNWNQFQLHRIELTNPDESILLQFEVEQEVQLVVVANFSEPPDSTKNKTEFIFVVPLSADPTVKNPYSLLLSNEHIRGRAGSWWIGVREKIGSGTSVPDNNELTEIYKKGSGQFKKNYNLTTWTTKCNFLNSTAEEWSTTGCKVSRESTGSMTVCLCNHMTTFGGGFFVTPNVIDWNFVFNNADFLSNPTIYITQIFIAICFIIAFILARRKDKKDLQQVGLSPLIDNDPQDKYYYEVYVATGARRNAGTESKVFFIMSGEEDETDIRMFSDSKRPIFKRGMTNGFLMAVPECLGRINYLHIWHDNSGKGKFGSWFLNYIVVKDVQKNTKQLFIANRWLAVEEDDGQVERVIPEAGKMQLEDFSYQFTEKSKRNMAEDHLWFSVIARPPGSTFTCVERVACCLCLLFMTMLANAMFYQTQGNSSTTSSTSFTFGPFALSVSQASNFLFLPI